MQKTWIALALVFALLFALCLPAFAEDASGSPDTPQSSESSSVPSEESETSQESSEIPILSIEEAYAQMTGTDYLILFGGFFGSMVLAMALYYFYLKNKRKKKVDKFRRP